MIINSENHTVLMHEDHYRKIMQYKTERDTLIDDIAVLKANISRLERENGQLKKEEKVNRTKASLLTEIKILKEKNERLRKVNSNGWKQKERNYQLLKINDRLYLDNYKLEHENKRLTGLTRKLTTHRTMWDNLKDWRRDMLEIDKNDTQLIGLGLVMDELEKDNLYKEDE